MTRFTVRVSVDPAYRNVTSVTFLRGVARIALEQLGVADRTGLDIGVIDEGGMRELNKRYRGLDEPTDVLSFPYSDRAAQALFYGETPPGQGSQAEFVVPRGTARSLGEVVIALPYAQHQAQERGHPLREELALLLIHGILHLLGYDHQEKEDELRMWEESRRLLSLLG